MLLSRRHFLSSTALFGVGAFVAGCAGQSAATIAAEAASDINLIGSGLAAALPGLATSGVVPAPALSQVSGYIATIKTVASSVTTASSVAQGQNAVQQIETLLNSVVAALAGLALPAPFGPALSAASVLLPVVETAVGLAVNAVKGTTAPGAAAPAMSPDTAREVLAAAAGR